MNVETMGTVQTGASPAGAAQSSSACAAQPSDLLPSRGVVEATFRSSSFSRGKMEVQPHATLVQVDILSQTHTEIFDNGLTGRFLNFRSDQVDRCRRLIQRSLMTDFV